MGHTQNFTEIGHSSFRFVSFVSFRSFRFVSFWHLQTNGFFSTEVHYLCQRGRDKQKRELERKIKWEKIHGRTVKWIEKDEKKNTKMKEIEMEKVRKARKQRKDGLERSVNVFFPFIGVRLTFQRCNNQLCGRLQLIQNLERDHKKMNKVRNSSLFYTNKNKIMSCQVFGCISLKIDDKYL